MDRSPTLGMKCGVWKKGLGARRLRKSGGATFGVFGLGWASGGRMRSVETVEWKLGINILIP
jgi:hypothetical protein